MAFLNLFGRLSFILFPIVLIYPGIQIKKRIGFLTSLFALSTFFYMIFCFGYALYKSLNIVEGTLVFDAIPQDYIWLNYFYGSDLTLTQHPSYISMYVLLSSVISLEAFFNYSQRFWVRLGWLVIGIILLLSLYFLSSRAAILIGIIMLSLYFGLKLNEIGKKKLTWLMVIFLVIAVSYVTFKLADQSQNSIKSLFFSQQANNKLTRDPRSVIWKSALDVSGKNLLVGVGIGDVRNELAREYYKRGEVNMAKERLNAHNQFLEILLESGIIGLGIFLLIITIMFYIAFVDKNIIYGVFLVTIILFFLFESILYRLAGVTFFSLFSFLLIHNNEENKLKE
ncbi:MAG TPA: O-antigen ligase family protein [Bacteroidales bacterium]|nr:O-antigen ligase family protein [Bacteroidales bacterium]